MMACIYELYISHLKLMVIGVVLIQVHIRIETSHYADHNHPDLTVNGVASVSVLQPGSRAPVCKPQAIEFQHTKKNTGSICWCFLLTMSDKIKRLLHQ